MPATLSCALSTEISALWLRWRNLLEKAREFKLLWYSQAELLQMKAKLQKCSPRIDPRLLEMGSVAVCGMFLCDYPVITAVYKYCCCETKKNFNETDLVWTAKVNRFWNLLKSTLLPVLTLVRKPLPATAEPQSSFRGISFNSVDELNGFIPKIGYNGTLTQLKSWTNSLEVAMRFSKPNEGLVGRMNLMQRRMITMGLKKELTTNHRLLMVTVVPCISVQLLAVNESESEFWLTGEDHIININVANQRRDMDNA